MRLLLAFLLLPQADPAHHPWMKWKPGSWVRVKQAEGQPDVVLTLKDVKDSGYSLTLDFYPGGGAQKNLTQTQDWGPGSECVHCDPKAEMNREETLKLGGKDYACKVYRLTQTGAVAGQREAWIAAGVSVPLKLVEKKTIAATELKLEAVRLDQEVAVGKKKIQAVRLEGTLLAPNGLSKVVRWLSAEIPGGFVKEETAPPKDGKKQVRAASDFEAKK
jgi:hypothetical protein